MKLTQIFIKEAKNMKTPKNIVSITSNQANKEELNKLK